MPATLEHLREDHEEALERVDRAGRALQAVGQGRPIEAVKPALSDLTAFVDSLLKVHIPFEEEVLYPMLSGFTEVQGPMAEIAEANETLRSFHSRFSSELRANKPDAGVVVETGNRVVQALGEHMRLGDLVLHPFARRMLTRDRVAELEARLRERTAVPTAYPLPIIEI